MWFSLSFGTNTENMVVCHCKIKARECECVFLCRCRRKASVNNTSEMSISVFVSAPYVPSSHFHPHPITPCLHLFTKACLLQFCVTERGSLEVHTLANAPTLSDYFAADSTHSMWYKGSHEIRSNYKTGCSNVPKLTVKKLSDPLQSWFWYPIVHSVGKALMWRIGGRSELWGTVRQSKLSGAIYHVSISGQLCLAR